MLEKDYIRDYVREVPLKMLMKGTAIIMIAPIMIITILLMYNRIDTLDAVAALLAIFIISVIFVRPYLANLSALTDYVEKLAEDKKAMPPDLSFLNNVEELSAAVERLQNSWEIRRNQLEGYLGESKIIIDSLPNILILLDDKLRIVQTNNTAKSVFRKQGLNETLNSVINSDPLNSAARNVLETGQGRSIDLRLDDPAPHDYMVRIEKFPVFSPRRIALIVVMNDVTALKRSEKTFADFVANASHEIRTPLTSIMGFIETLRTSAKDDEKARDQFLSIMEEQAERMSRLVKDLLSLSKIERNITTKPTEIISIRPVIKDAVNQLSYQAEEKGININKKIEKNLPEIIGDKGELEQVVYNLVNNAIKYGKENSTITIEAKSKKNELFDVDILRGAKKILSISVKDEGEGIPVEHIPRLTERFYRVDTARSRKIGGTGLGLSIAKHILDRHQGHMLIESEVGKGSTFTILLPVPD